ncbi:hypothetical protein HOLleu_00138 [Holothuria leucospilota]|uniref:Uncharacterized protein n=1 Tax=Holothuria leucospilota TaxID=206669 RepID=A0A9Q1CNY9_HOLLE|nr:hypothetical protein HOLleu_00138 [Holothuria leucospilota]
MKTTVVFLIVAALVTVSFQSKSDESERAARHLKNNRRFRGHHHHTPGHHHHTSGRQHHTSGHTVSNNVLSNFKTGHNTARNGEPCTGLING